MATRRLPPRGRGFARTDLRAHGRSDFGDTNAFEWTRMLPRVPALPVGSNSRYVRWCTRRRLTDSSTEDRCLVRSPQRRHGAHQDSHGPRSPFRAMVRSPETAQTMAPRASVEVVAGDFNNAATIERTLTGIDRAFLLTPSSEQAEAQQSTFVEVARRVGCSTSSSSPSWPPRGTRRSGSCGTKGLSSGRSERRGCSTRSCDRTCSCRDSWGFATRSPRKGGCR